MGSWTMTGWHASWFAVVTEVILSLSASGPSGIKVLLLNGKSSWKTFKKYGCLFLALSPGSIVPRATQDPILQLLDCPGHVESFWLVKRRG